MHMKKVIFAILLISLLSVSASAQAKTIRVKSYYKKTTGTYVTTSHRTSPNRTKLDNYSTKGNYNPYTGESGTKSPFSSYKRK